MTGATIRIFLADGTPLGLRVIEKSNWTGRGFDFARSDWPKVRARDDFSRPGVYVLHGLGDDGLTRIYIGEADELRKRLNQHFAGPAAKEFWTRAVAFSSKDENLNKAHVRYLESRLIALGLAAKRATLENGTVPAPPSLSEYDRAEAETFLDEMLVIYPLLGIDAFAPPSKAPDPAASKTEVPSLHEYIRELRATLLATGVLVDTATALRLTQDYTFGSPSTAAAVMLGRTSNGRMEWKNDKGQSLKAIQEAAAAG